MQRLVNYWSNQWDNVEMTSPPLLGEGNGNPLQYSCLENPMDRGAWQATVHGVTRVGHDLATKPPNHLFLYTCDFHWVLTNWKIDWCSHSFIHQIQLFLPFYFALGSDQIRSVAQSCPTPCDPMNRSMPGLPVHHQLPEFTQTHIHRVSDAIQPSHPLSSPSPPAPNPSRHQSLFQWVNSSHKVAKVW